MNIISTISPQVAQFLIKIENWKILQKDINLLNINYRANKDTNACYGWVVIYVSNGYYNRGKIVVNLVC